MEVADYYVYVYIDPRSLEEFYYGKGRGSRKAVHLDEAGDNQKIKLISAIKAAGLSPIIKVVAAGLTEAEALLIEKTLICRMSLGCNLSLNCRHLADVRSYNVDHMLSGRINQLPVCKHVRDRLQKHVNVKRF